MILLLGASGFIGRGFASELRRRGLSFIPLTRPAFDYTRFDFLFDYLRTMKPVFLINAAGFSGTGGGAGSGDREKMMAANAILPQMIARACFVTKTPWAHVSTGDIFSGGKVFEDDKLLAIPDLSGQEWSRLFEKDPARFHGYTEMDEPNFTLRTAPLNLFSGSKALAEEAIKELGQIYIWRPRRLFNEKQEPCNFLHRLQSQPAVHDHINSISHLEDFVKAALDLWEIRAPFGIYNMTNPGAVTSRQIIDGLRRGAKTVAALRIGLPEEDPGRLAGPAPQSNCILDVARLLKTGVRMRPAHDALKDAVDRMRLAARPGRRPDSRPGSNPSP